MVDEESVFKKQHRESGEALDRLKKSMSLISDLLLTLPEEGCNEASTKRLDDMRSALAVDWVFLRGLESVEQENHRYLDMVVSKIYSAEVDRFEEATAAAALMEGSRTD